MGSIVFKGPRYRVQLHIFDHTGEPIPVEFRKEKPIFSVTILPSTSNKFAAFSTGTTVYHDSDFKEAWQHVEKYCGESKVPTKLSKYVNQN